MTRVLLVKVSGLKADGTAAQKKNPESLTLDVFPGTFAGSDDAVKHIADDGWYAIVPAFYFTQNQKQNAANNSPAADHPEGKGDQAQTSEQKMVNGDQGSIGGLSQETNPEGQPNQSQEGQQTQESGQQAP